MNIHVDTKPWVWHKEELAEEAKIRKNISICYGLLSFLFLTIKAKVEFGPRKHVPHQGEVHQSIHCVQAVQCSFQGLVTKCYQAVKSSGPPGTRS